MASNSNGGATAMGESKSLIPIFQGVKYELWAVRMKTLLRAQDLWDLGENGFNEAEEEPRRIESK